MNRRAFIGALLVSTSAPALARIAQQLSQDWSDVNYSSARAALLEAWKRESLLERWRGLPRPGYPINVDPVRE